MPNDTHETTTVPRTGDVAPGPETDVATGAIKGIVVDSEIRPLANVTVSISEEAVSVVTGDDGRYLLALLPPGEYWVEANATGYIGLRLRAEVQAETVTYRNFTLEPTATGAYVAVYHRVGYLTLSSWTPDQFLLGKLNMTCTQCKLTIRLNDEPRQYLHEFLFQPSYALTTQICWHLHRNATEDYGVITPGHIFSGCTENRGSKGFNPPAIKPWDRLFTLYVTGEQTSGPAINQRVDVWFSIAHGANLPTGWTALPKG